MSAYLAAISESGVWPVVHIFIPATITIYSQNIFLILSIIYLWETVEYIISTFPGAEYFEETKMDTLVFDILMGLLGFWTIYSLQYCKKIESNNFNSCCTKKWQHYLHLIFTLITSCTPALFIQTGIIKQGSIGEFSIFCCSFIFTQFCFGYYNWALFSTINMLIITIIAFYTEYTIIVAGVCVFTSTMILNWTIFKKSQYLPIDQDL